MKKPLSDLQQALINDANEFSDLIQRLKTDGSPRDYVVIIVDESEDKSNMVTVRSCGDVLYNAALLNKAASMELKEEIDRREKAAEAIQRYTASTGGPIN